jgi:hypothetical protein
MQVGRFEFLDGSEITPWNRTLPARKGDLNNIGLFTWGVKF